MASPGKIEARITVPTGGWDMALTDASGGPTTCTLPAGEYYHSSVGSLSDDLAAAIAAAANAVMTQTWTCTISAGASGTGKYTIGCDGATCTVTFTDTELRDLLGYTGNLSASTSYTSTNQAQGIWLPGYPFQTPGGGAFPGKIKSDQQTAMTSSGHTFSVMGRKMRVKQITWPMEARAKVLAVAETTTNASFETFLIDGIYGEAAWGTSAGPIRFYADETDDATYLSYYVHGLEEWDPRELVEHWAGGYYPVTLPMLVQVPA